MSRVEIVAVVAHWYEGVEGFLHILVRATRGGTEKLHSCVVGCRAGGVRGGGGGW